MAGPCAPPITAGIGLYGRVYTTDAAVLPFVAWDASELLAGRTLGSLVATFCHGPQDLAPGLPVASHRTPPITQQLAMPERLQLHTSLGAFQRILSRRFLPADLTQR